MVNLEEMKRNVEKLTKKVSKLGEDEKKSEEKFECECLDCNHKFKSEEHCNKSVCPECGSDNCRRESRPGPGQDSTKDTDKSHGEEEPVTVEEPETTPDDNMKDGVFTIPIIGEIGWDVTAEGINAQLAKAEGKDVVFEIASPGGSVYEGIEIFNAIRNYKGETTAKIVGMAASMASYIPLATNKVLAEDNAVYMIHNAWTIAMGDSEELKAESEVLESINETIALAYVTKTGKKEKDILQMMSDETWLFGDEIKKEGFVDEMIDHSKDEKKDKKEEAKTNKETTIATAKTKVKDMFLKLQKDRMKADIDKIKQKGNGGVSKMEDKKDYISKLEDENVETVKGVISKLNELANAKKITKDDVKKLAQELEASIIVTKSDKPAHQEEPTKKVEANADEVNAGEKEVGKDDKDKPDEGDAKDKPDDADKDKPDEEGKDKPDDNAAEDDKDKDKEDTSKQSEIEKGYRKVADEAVSKLTEVYKLYGVEKDKNETLTKANIKLTDQIAKFKETLHKELVNDVVDEISKFKELDDKSKIKKVDELSKMSDEALDIMKAEFTKVNVSKMENEEENNTEPSQNLEGKDNGEDSVSKMKAQEKEEVDAAINRTFHK